MGKKKQNKMSRQRHNIDVLSFLPFLFLINKILDRGREFLQMSVRGLYKYVLEVITTPYHMPTAYPSSTAQAAADPSDIDDSSSKDGAAKRSPMQTTNKCEGGAADETSQEEKSRHHADLTYRDRLGE